MLKKLWSGIKGLFTALKGFLKRNEAAVSNAAIVLSGLTMAYVFIAVMPAWWAILIALLFIGYACGAFMMKVLLDGVYVALARK